MKRNIFIGLLSLIIYTQAAFAQYEILPFAFGMYDHDDRVVKESAMYNRKGTFKIADKSYSEVHLDFMYAMPDPYGFYQVTGSAMNFNTYVEISGVFTKVNLQGFYNSEIPDYPGVGLMERLMAAGDVTVGKHFYLAEDGIVITAEQNFRLSDQLMSRSRLSISLPFNIYSGAHVTPGVTRKSWITGNKKDKAPRHYSNSKQVRSAIGASGEYITSINGVNHNYYIWLRGFNGWNARLFWFYQYPSPSTKVWYSHTIGTSVTQANQTISRRGSETDDVDRGFKPRFLAEYKFIMAFGAWYRYKWFVSAQIGEPLFVTDFYNVGYLSTGFMIKLN